MSDKEEKSCSEAVNKPESKDNHGSDENKQMSEDSEINDEIIVQPNNYDSDVVAGELEIEDREIYLNQEFC